MAAAPVAVRDRTTVPVELVADPKIHPRHLVRQALIYVRQSHPNQVQRHPESARRQYGLVERAEQLGWGREQISVIDEDQGKSAAGSAASHGRDGFAQLVSAVGLGEVGVVLALEVSRLARNSAEWYRLLELAALAGTLIADDATVYEPRVFSPEPAEGPAAAGPARRPEHREGSARSSCTASRSACRALA